MIRSNEIWLDHLVYATTDVGKSVDELEKCLGVRAASGGQHPGRGTRNALIALSSSSYLEIVGPDADQAPPGVQRWFGIDAISNPRLFTWAIKAGSVSDDAAAAVRRGVPLGPVVRGSRKRSDGAILRWECTDPATVVGDGLVPFLIDWGNSPHPATSAPSGPVLASLRGQHPEPEVIRRLLAALGIDLPVERGSHPTLIATLRTASGTVEIR